MRHEVSPSITLELGGEWDTPPLAWLIVSHSSIGGRHAFRMVDWLSSTASASFGLADRKQCLWWFSERGYQCLIVQHERACVVMKDGMNDLSKLV